MVLSLAFVFVAMISTLACNHYIHASGAMPSDVVRNDSRSAPVKFMVLMTWRRLVSQ